MSGEPGNDAQRTATSGTPQMPTLAAVVRERTSLPWSRAKRLCEDGRVTVDGRTVTDPAARVPEGADVVIAGQGPKARAGALRDDAIVHADRDLVVVDKPSGLLTVADEAGNRDTLADHVRTLLRRLRVPGEDVPLGVVHRLDRETSGVMVFARSALAKRLLADQFRAHTAERVYVALVHGAAGAMRIDTALVLDRGDGLRGSHGHLRRASGPPPQEARRAITHVTPVAALRGATLVECHLETGRQHQIRIHLAESGHPLLGENVYVRDWRGPWLPAPRIMLHARRLGFLHPRSGRPMVFERDPPADFDQATQALAP